jgi:hypothetical protein
VSAPGGPGGELGDQRAGRTAQQRAAAVDHHETCSALRGLSRTPQWAFVREGPTWHGHRVAGWDELFA